MDMNSRVIKIWFWVAVTLAAASLLGLLCSVILQLKVWGIVFAVFTLLSGVHAGAVGVFYVAELEVARLDAELYEGAKK